jgi:hypothetical protein
MLALRVVVPPRACATLLRAARAILCSLPRVMASPQDNKTPKSPGLPTKAALKLFEYKDRRGLMSDPPSSGSVKDVGSPSSAQGAPDGQKSANCLYSPIWAITTILLRMRLQAHTINRALHHGVTLWLVCLTK